MKIKNYSCILQNYEEMNHRGHRGHGEIRVLECYCVSPINIRDESKEEVDRN